MPKASDRRSKRRTLRALHGDACWICGYQMQFDDTHAEDYATFEHVVPIADGGTWHNANLRLSHRICNQKRGEMHHHGWLAA
jgi:5-methylcytosine-specific restriction endonuclease McrA